MATTTPLVTAEDLERMGPQGEYLELIRGVIREREAMGGRHGEVCTELLTALWFHAHQLELGRVYPALTHFVLGRDPDTVVKFDAAFVRADHLPTPAEREGFMRCAPDLAAEVVSPIDRFADVMERIDLYLEAGVSIVWLVEPRRRTVTVFAGTIEPLVLTEGDVLDGGDVLPGFGLPVASVFR